MIGRHLLVDMYGVAPERLNDAARLAECLVQAAACCGLTPVAPPKMHSFEGGGVTGFLLLAESHIALHTYPEYGYIALDVFSCGPRDPKAAIEVFRAALRPQREVVRMLERGEERE